MSAFDRSARLQVELPDILTGIAAPRVPDYVDDILAQTAVTRQRPRWTFIERWLPMGVIARRMVLFPRVPWRTLVAVALLIALLAAALLIAGSQQKLPAPFGPAKNGIITYGQNGDIYARDTLDGTPRLLIGGTTDDFAANFTRTGTKLIFLRRLEDGTGGTASPNERLEIYTANLDGTNVKRVSDAIEAPDWWDFSPDDKFFVVQGTVLSNQHLFIVPTDGSAPARKIEFGQPLSATFPNFLGPDGTEIVFRGIRITDSGSRSGIYAVHPDGSGLRSLTATDGEKDDDFQFPAVSPDGRWLTYGKWDPSKDQARVHLVNLATREDRELQLTSPDRQQGSASFSPDSKLIMFNTWFNDRVQVMIAPVDGTSKGLGMGPSYPIPRDGYVGGMFSPDGKSVIIIDQGTDEMRLVDVKTGGAGTRLSFSSAEMSGWQRVAP